MTPHSLTDDRLAAGLRAHLPVAHQGLHERIVAEVAATPQDRRLPSILGRLTDADPLARRRMVLAVGLVALALSLWAAAVAGALLREQRTPDLVVEPTADVGVVARGWPGSGHNPPGVYSAWGETACSSSFCVYGVMHNGYGSGDVEIRIQILPRLPAIAEGTTAVTVAGHPATYRQTDGLEEWIVDIDGTAVEISVKARPGTSPADLAEAHAIIESMRTEPQDDELGFMLTFRLTTDHWDSG